MADKPIDTRSRDLDRRLSQADRGVLHNCRHVIGTGIGLQQVDGEFTDQCAIIVYVTHKFVGDDLRDEDIIPETIECDGETIPTDVRQVRGWTGDSGSPTRREEVRPVVGGTEVGANGQRGTVTALFEDRDGEERLLTARHAISDETGTVTGERVSQPAGGEEIGEVINASLMSVEGTTVNTLDTAVIELDSDVDAQGLYLGYREATDTGRPSLGDRVITLGADGMGAGTVISRGVQTTLDDPWDEAEFAGLVEYDWDSTPGSSGAAVCRLDTRTRELTIVGQHIGGSDGTALMADWARIERTFGDFYPVDETGIARTESFGDPGDDDDDDVEPGTLTVIVEGDAGSRLEGATVTVTGEDEDTDSDTDGSGEVEFDLDPGSYDISVEASGYDGGSGSVTIDEGGTHSETVVLDAEDEEEPSDVTITVEDDDSDPIEDVTVTAERSGFSEESSTDSSGEVTFELDAGSYDITAEATGFEDETISLTVDWNSSYSETITLERPDEPTLVDDFERSDIDPWTNTHDENNVEIEDDELQVVAASSAEVDSGLENFPEAGGGPNGDGAFEVHLTMTETGGTTDTCRFDVATGGSDPLRFEFGGDSLDLRFGTTSQMTFFQGVSFPEGEDRILRMHEWRADGTIDFEILTGDEESLDRQSGDLDNVPTEGGMAVWVNYTTGYSVDRIELID